MFKLNELVQLKYNIDPQNGLYTGAIGEIIGYTNKVDCYGDNNERPIKYLLRFNNSEATRTVNSEVIEAVKLTQWHTQCGTN